LELSTDTDEHDAGLPTEQSPREATEPVSIVNKIIEFITSRYILSVGAQALMSGFHFFIGIYLVRNIPPYDYGVYAYAFVLAMFAGAVNNALISTPLTVYSPVIKEQAERLEQEAMFSTLNLLLFVCLLMAGLVYGFFSETAKPITLSVTAFVAVYAARQFSRSFGYARLKPLVTATGDIVYVVAGILLLTTVVLLSTNNETGDGLVSLILLALAAANIIAMFVERWRLHGAGRRWLLLANIKNYGHIWEQSRWALAGALTTLFLSQAHALIVAGTHGPKAFGPLAAGMVLFAPVRVALLTWQNMVKPEIALALSDNQGDAVKKQVRKSVILMGIAVLALGACIFLGWPYLKDIMYSNKYADQPMGYIVSIWFAITLFAALYNAPSAALQAMRDFRILANASIYGALISGVLVTLLLYFVDPASTLLGILAAELFMALFLTRVMLNHLKKDWK